MELRVAGSDTREAMSTRAVRLAAQSAAVAAAPGWAAAFLAPVAWEAHLDIAGTGPWLTPLCLALGIGSSGWTAPLARRAFFRSL